MSLKPHFSRFLGARPQRLHFCAHSHHPWPDSSLEAHRQAWIDAAELADAKWDKVFGEVVPAAQHHLARLLNLPDPTTLCFAPNTHELLMRLISAIEPRPFRVLTTDSEFMSFDRQLRRLEEAGSATVDRVAVEPWATFPARFVAAAIHGGHHLVYFSHVFYDSGYWIPDLTSLVQAVPSSRSLIVVDGYHAFMAVPVDLGRIAARVFYLGGGYKYAMSGEGVAWMHCPPGLAPRPLDTGWFAGFGQLSERPGEAVRYAADGSRFWGATFDPSGLYRFNAVMDWMRRHGLSVAAIRAHAVGLQREFLSGLDGLGHPLLRRERLLPPDPCPRGNFLSFRGTEAAATQRQLEAADVVTDLRGDRLRIGFGVYQDRADVAELLRRLADPRLRAG